MSKPQHKLFFEDLHALLKCGHIGPVERYCEVDQKGNVIIIGKGFDNIFFEALLKMCVNHRRKFSVVASEKEAGKVGVLLLQKSTSATSLIASRFQEFAKKVL